MEKIKLASSETKPVVTEIFGSEHYVIWKLATRAWENDVGERFIDYYFQKILEIHDSKEAALNAIKNNKYYNDVYISPATHITKEQYVKPVSGDEK